MDRPITFATKHDFLHACVVAAMLAITVAALFGELAGPAHDVFTWAITLRRAVA